MINKLKPSEFIELLTPLRPYLFSAALFSCAINILMIVPAIYMLQVYDRAGEPCNNCKKPIKMMRIGQRSTFYCSHCQS